MDILIILDTVSRKGMNHQNRSFTHYSTLEFWFARAIIQTDGVYKETRLFGMPRQLLVILIF